MCLRLIVAVLVGGAPLSAGDVTLAWDPNSESDLAGYRVYFGTASRTYGPPITIDTRTTYTVAGLAAGIWYFAVTAYNTSGLESDYSNEVWAVVTPSDSACDINADTSCDALDLQSLVNVVLGGPCPRHCDINTDGCIDALDLQVLVNVVLGVMPCP